MLVAGGFFVAAGGVRASYVANWAGASWAAMGAEGLSGPVRSLAVFGGDLYAAGAFAGIGAIARYDSGQGAWLALSTSPAGGAVVALAGSTLALYAGGVFASTNSGAKSVSVGNVAAWNGTAWLSLGNDATSNVTAGVDGSVAALLPAVCSDGRTGAGCSSCLSGYYGPDCVPCSVCAAVNGTCYDGLAGNCSCPTGFTGPTCIECDTGYYGVTCQPCANCTHGICSPGRTGMCMCSTGWAGDSCAEGYSQTEASFPIWVLIALLSGLVFAFACVGSVAFARRRSRMKRSRSRLSFGRESGQPDERTPIGGVPSGYLGSI